MRLIAIALVLGLAVAGAALVASQTAGAHGDGRAKGGLLKVAADYIGIDRKALAKELREGSSLAQSAVAHGKTRAGLKEALLDAIEARVDARTGLTAERKAQILERSAARVDRLIDRTGAPKRKGKRAAHGTLKVAADYIGVEPRALAAELRSGKSLAEAAVSHGKTRAGLKAALLAAAEARIDKLLDRKRSG